MSRVIIMVTEKELANFASVWERVTETNGEAAAIPREERRAEPVFVSEKHGTSRAVRFLPDF